MRTYFFLNHFLYFSYTQAYMVVTIKSGLLGLLSGRTEKYSPYHLVIMTSNPDNATSILGWESWGVKLGRVLREGWHTPSIHSCQLQQHSCVEVGGWRFPLCVCYAASLRKEHVMALTLPVLSLSCVPVWRGVWWVGFGHN